MGEQDSVKAFRFIDNNFDYNQVRVQLANEEFK